MAIVIDASVGGASSNSYCTLAEAETYHDSRLHNEDWTTGTDANKNIALVWATRLLDEWVDWNGSKVEFMDEQVLRWPRYNVQDRDGEDFDSDIIPQFLKDATAELGKDLLAEDVTADADTKGYSQMKIDVLSFTIDKTDRDATTVLSDTVQSMVEPYGVIRSRGSSGSVELLRA